MNGKDKIKIQESKLKTKLIETEKNRKKVKQPRKKCIKMKFVIVDFGVT